jgi:hypothetical protein
LTMLASKIDSGLAAGRAKRRGARAPAGVAHEERHFRCPDGFKLSQLRLFARLGTRVALTGDFCQRESAQPLLFIDG